MAIGIGIGALALLALLCVLVLCVINNSIDELRQEVHAMRSKAAGKDWEWPTQEEAARMFGFNSSGEMGRWRDETVDKLATALGAFANREGPM